MYALWYNHFDQLSTEEETNKIFVLGIVFFTIRWWDPAFFEAMHPEGTAGRASWPYVESKSYLWTWLFLVPLAAYSLWQVLYFLIVNVLRRQRLLRDPEVMTSYRFLILSLLIPLQIWQLPMIFWLIDLYVCRVVQFRGALGNSRKKHRKQITYGGD